MKGLNYVNICFSFIFTHEDGSPVHVTGQVARACTQVLINCKNPSLCAEASLHLCVAGHLRESHMIGR